NLPQAGDGNRTHVSSLEGWCSTIELHPQEKVIGVTGFEPATSWSQTRRSSQAEPHPVLCSLSAVTQKLLYNTSSGLSTFLQKNFTKNLSDSVLPHFYPVPSGYRTAFSHPVWGRKGFPD